MVLISAMSLFVVLYVTLLAITSMRKDASLTEAFPLQLQGCQNDDVDLLLVAESLLTNSLESRLPFLSDLLDYFLPDDVLQTSVKVAMAGAHLSESPSQIFSFPFGNTTDNDVVPILSDKPTLTFETYNTTEDVAKQLNLIPVVNLPEFYVNGTFVSSSCNPTDLLNNLRQNSSDVGAVIVGHITSHVIERYHSNNNQYGRSCKLKMFLILVGHDTKDIVLHQTTLVKNRFYLPSLDNHVNMSGLLCTICTDIPVTLTAPWRLLDLRNDRYCYFLQVHSSPVTWFEASNDCKLLQGQRLVSLETKEELEFTKHILDNYIETKYQEKIAKLDSSSNSERFSRIYIGLVRDASRVGSPFQWINGYNTGVPLVYSHWLNALPTGGPNQRCALWLFRKNMEWSESLGRTIYNSSNLEMNYNGWEDIGCGSSVTDMALCKIIVRQNWYEDTTESLKAIPANTVSFTQVFSRGEFANFQDKIISVPAFVRDPQYARVLKKSGSFFKVFGCNSGDDDINIIPHSYVCDHIEHCELGQDERNCWYRTCDPDTEFTCSSGQCVSLESRCDVYTDCYDGSDEEDCQFCNSAMCCDGLCIPRHFVLNGEVDCVGCDGNEQDESPRLGEDMRDYDCPFICNRSECVTPSMLNDNITQCLGPEGPLDEIWGKLETVNSCKINYEFKGSPIEFVRWSPRCVYIKDRYGTVIGCRDMSHLHDCQNFTCPEGYVKCPDSYCIPLHLVHDGHFDCPNGEEELRNTQINCTGNFKCWGREVCVHPDLVCDGYPHCPFGDDELNCHVSCAEGFQCIGGTVTVKDFDKSKPLQNLSFIDKRTRYIDLSGVNLSAVVSDGNVKRFQNTVQLYLSHCQIAYLDGNMSYKFSWTGVYLLDLSYNQISRITDYSMLSFMYNLRVLNLSHNKLLVSIDQNAFRVIFDDYPGRREDYKSIIENLNLAFTSINILDNGTFENLQMLKYLDLSYTQISVVGQNFFPKEFNLQTLDLRGTPLSNIEPNALTSLSVSKDLYSDLYKLCCPQVRGQGIPEHVCHAPASAISSCMDLIQEPAQRVLLWTVGVLAVTGNLVVITYRLLWDRAVLKKSYGLFVTNLSVSDLFMGVYLLIIAGTDVIYRDNYVWYESDWRHSTLCQTAGFLSTLSSETSAFFILLVTIDRFLVIKFPFGHFRFTRWSMIISCVIAWSVGFVLALIPALPRFQHWQMYSSNGMCLGLPLTPDRRSGWEYSAALFIGLNFILFLFIACGQYLIYSAMSENSLKTSSAVQSNAKRVQEIMVAKQLSLVVLSDFLCWFPIGIMGLLAMSGRDIGTEVYAWSAVLVLPINSALNPVLYTVPLIMKKWEDFKSGNRKKNTSKSFQSTESTKETLP